MENEPQQQTTSTPSGGRGMFRSMVQAQPPSVQSVTKETAPPKISSTPDALAQMRLKRREEASSSSDTKAPKAPTLQELQAEAAPLVEPPEEEIPEKRGTSGMVFYFFLEHFFLRK